MRKIAIIGIGAVGATTAFSIMEAGLCNDLVLIDLNAGLAEGEAMDMEDGVPFCAPCRVYAGGFSDCQGADIVIIAAGAAQKPGETRLDLASKNTAILRSILAQIRGLEIGLLLLVTNPVDVLTAIALRESGLPGNRVLGSGTVLDTARLQSSLGRHVGIDPRSVQGYVLGEHGDSEIIPWSLVRIAGMPLEEYCALCRNPCADKQEGGPVIVGECKALNFPREGLCPACAPCVQETFARIEEDVRRAAYQILARKGATNYAIALAVRRIVKAVLYDEHTVLTVSVPAPPQYPACCLSLPAVVGAGGIERVLPVALTEREEAALRHSAQTLNDIIKQVQTK